MTPQAGTVCTLVPPTAPVAALDADNAKAGTVEKLASDKKEAASSSLDSTTIKPHKPPETKEDKANKKSWIEIKLVDEEGQPVPGEPYRILLPDGTAAEGSLDADGFARVDGFDPGQCEVTFPNLDKDSCKPQ